MIYGFGINILCSNLHYCVNRTACTSCIGVYLELCLINGNVILISCSILGLVHYLSLKKNQSYKVKQKTKTTWAIEQINYKYIFLFNRWTFYLKWFDLISNEVNYNCKKIKLVSSYSFQFFLYTLMKVNNCKKKIKNKKEGCLFP